MSKLSNLVGQKFNRLTVMRFEGKNKNRQSIYLCKCDCGKELMVLGYTLKNNHTKSCGCLKLQKLTRHGYSRSKIYNVWHDIVQRCNNKNNCNYKYYGGRGVSVCDRWLKFENFLEDMGEPPTNKHEIDRIENDLGYHKENCRWATRKNNNRNKSNNRLIHFQNKDWCFAELAEVYNICPNTLRHRLNKGLSIEQSILMNSQQGKRLKEESNNV